MKKHTIKIKSRAVREFERLPENMSQREDMEELLDLRTAKEQAEDAPTITLEQLKRRL